jgi:hypothetical protein
MKFLFLRDLRRESETKELAESVMYTERTIEEIRSALDSIELELVGSGNLRQRSHFF